MLVIRTVHGQLLGTIKLDGTRLVGDTAVARAFVIAALRRFGSARIAYRELPGTSDSWTLTTHV